MFSIEDVVKMVESWPEGWRGELNPVDELTGSRCNYTNEDAKHCIAGQICVDLGLKVPAWGDEDNMTGISYLGHLTVHFAPEAIHLLMAMQQHADGGEVWGSAFDYAITLLAVGA